MKYYSTNNSRTKPRNSWVITANITRIQNQIEQGKCKNPYAAANLIKKMQRELE